jgi:hypothetical protein
MERNKAIPPSYLYYRFLVIESSFSIVLSRDNLMEKNRNCLFNWIKLFITSVNFLNNTCVATDNQGMWIAKQMFYKNYGLQIMTKSWINYSLIRFERGIEDLYISSPRSV